MLPPLTRRRSVGLDLGVWFRFMAVGFPTWCRQNLISHSAFTFVRAQVQFVHAKACGSLSRDLLSLISACSLLFMCVQTLILH